MTEHLNGHFESWLRERLTRRAASVSAIPDEIALSAIATKGKKRHQRRQWGAGVAAAVAFTLGIGLVVTSGVGGGPQVGRGPYGAQAHRTVLLLPLSGTVSASGPSDRVSHNEAASGALSLGPSVASGVTSGGGAALGPIDVAPPTSASLQRLFSHTSADGVQMDLFDQPGSGATTPSAPSLPGHTAVGEPALLGCLTTTSLTLEVSDIAAVGTFSEPLFSGATGSLVDVQIGQVGVAEGAPATWVLVQTGSGAASVQVQFADDSTDLASVPTSGVVVLGHKGAPSSTLGSGAALASITVFGTSGQTIASDGLGVSTSSSTTGAAPNALPSPGPTQPSDPTSATTAVTKAVETALGCSSSPLQRSQDVTGGGTMEAVPDLVGTGLVNVDKVVFTSATAAVAQYHLQLLGSSQGTGPLYADVTLVGGAWQVSLSSVAPGLQVTPANQVGNVTVAPGGPLFAHSWPGGTAVAVYKALPGSQGASGYGTGDAACLSAGGIVEEVTTPGAVRVLTSALFPNYSSPLISVSVSTVGTGEGSPATVVGVEAGPPVANLLVTGTAGTVTETPANGVAVIVLVGDAASSLGTAGAQLSVSDTTGTVLETVPLQVDAAAPAGPSSLPSSLPSPGQGPADPQAATQAIDQAFATVFDCNNPPVQRTENVQDGSLVAGALEQLDTGPYEALASSSYVTVNEVVFENPTLADVAYTILFHSDTQLKFSMIGQALVIDGSWRVSYSTVCSAVQLGLGNCQT
jgi:hypothetical protein